MADQSRSDLQAALEARFSDAPSVPSNVPGVETLTPMASRGSCRDFLPRPVPPALLDILCATALAAPTKSDLQQRDIILLKSPDLRRKLSDLVSGQSWVADAPMILVFCGNNCRQRKLHDWHDVPFANDHLDAFFNAVGDAAIALGAFVTAAEALGLAGCPISAIRNEATAVSALLGLPDHVFPFAGLALGYPSQSPIISKRLPMAVTCHTDRYSEDNLRSSVQGYDLARSQAQPYEKQRFPDRFDASSNYAWSDDKVRQYSAPERADFAAYVRSIGFRLD